jgi:Fe-Mn family superoxide dismutase
MRAGAEAGRGWVMLACCPLDPTNLHNIVMDAHDNAPPGYDPLLVIDLFEHSYWGDWYTNKSGYLDGVFKNINWDEVNNRYTKLALASVARR